MILIKSLNLFFSIILLSKIQLFQLLTRKINWETFLCDFPTLVMSLVTSFLLLFSCSSVYWPFPRISCFFPFLLFFLLNLFLPFFFLEKDEELVVLYVAFLAQRLRQMLCSCAQKDYIVGADDVIHYVTSDVNVKSSNVKKFLPSWKYFPKK